MVCKFEIVRKVFVLFSVLVFVLLYLYFFSLVFMRDVFSLMLLLLFFIFLHNKMPDA